MAWTTGTISTNDPWNCITFGVDRFVTVANITGNSCYSSDGITWTQGANMPFSWYANSWQDIAYGNGKFVAVGWAYAGAVSIDGINWTRASLPYLKYWEGIAYGAPYFVVAGSGYTSTYGFPYSNQAVAITPDPRDWGSSVMDKAGVWTDIAYGNGKFVAITANSALSSVSGSAGRSWITSNTMPTAQSWEAIQFGNDKFVAIASNSSAAAYSPDGVTWTTANLPVSQQWIDLDYGNNQWVAVASNSNVAAISSDGITWSESIMPATQNWTAISYGLNRFVTIAANTTITAVLS